jgi:uncharacterized protein (TIGR03083 family)
MDGPEFDALQAQCEELKKLVGELSAEEWDRPTRCAPMTVKDMASHLGGIFERLAQYTGEKVEGPTTKDRVTYFQYDVEEISKRVLDRVEEESGSRTAEEVRDRLLESMGSALEGVRKAPAGQIVERPPHGKLEMREFVATRVLEAAVHAADIGHATLRGELIHPAAVPIVVGILNGLLGGSLPVGMGWDDRTYILTGTGRRRLEPNERFVLGEAAGKFPLLS